MAKAGRKSVEKERQPGASAADREYKLLQMSEISLWLDTYDDIFSDFDPRPYSQRALSGDFLDEAKKASRDKASGTIELKLLIPGKKRSKKDENLVRRRLREHFSRHYVMLRKEKKDTIIREGFSFIALGIILMFIATLIMFNEEKSLLANFLIIILEPGGWFLFWQGLDIVIFKSNSMKPDLEFYRKMSSCEISFYSY